MSTCSPKILVTGGNGQLAQAFCHHDLATQHNILLTSRDETDITNQSAIENKIQQTKPDVIINTAAYTAVDKAETECEKALTVNYRGTENLARACKHHQIPLIHISTDYVFDGEKSIPYAEDDNVNPINHYGKTKWLSEQVVREHCEQHIILRVSGTFSEYGTNFLKTMVRLAQEKNELNVIADQFTCPTYANDIATALYALAANPTHWGTYHFCSALALSWHEFAVAIIEESKQYKPLSVKHINAISYTEYNAAAKRPPYSVLDCSKIGKNFGIKQPSCTKAIKTILMNLFNH